jgi:hypothetical protein
MDVTSSAIPLTGEADGAGKGREVDDMRDPGLTLKDDWQSDDQTGRS